MESPEVLIANGKRRAQLKDQKDIMDRAYKFRCFYENDFEEIKKIIQNDLNGKTFSADTLEKLRIQHLNIIDKPLNRKASGIYDNEPKRMIKFPMEEVNETTEDGTTVTRFVETEKQKQQNELLNEILQKFNFNDRVREALKISEFFNIALAMPAIRDDNPESMKYSIDILLPDEYIPVTKKDYLLLDKISIERVDEDKNIYWVVFTEDKHYVMDELGTESEVEGRKEKDFVNPYNMIPVAILRKKIGSDFWGEPNWNLYNSQLETDIALTDMRFAEVYQHFGIYWGINTNFPAGTTFSPNTFIDLKHTDPNLPKPELNCLVPQVDFLSIRDNIDWRINKAQNLEGIPSASTSEKVNDLSGYSKEIDEGELNESRIQNISRCYRFELDLLYILATIWNYHENDKLDIKTGKFEIEYTEEKPHETVADKKQRREMEKEYNIATDVDFIIEDKECSRIEAEGIYQQNKTFNQKQVKTVSALDKFMSDGKEEN